MLEHEQQVRRERFRDNFERRRQNDLSLRPESVQRRSDRALKQNARISLRKLELRRHQF